MFHYNTVNQNPQQQHQHIPSAAATTAEPTTTTKHGFFTNGHFTSISVLPPPDNDKLTTMETLTMILSKHYRIPADKEPMLADCISSTLLSLITELDDDQPPPGLDIFDSDVNVSLVKLSYAYDYLYEELDGLPSDYLHNTAFGRRSPYPKFLYPQKDIEFTYPQYDYDPEYTWDNSSQGLNSLYSFTYHTPTIVSFGFWRMVNDIPTPVNIFNDPRVAKVLDRYKHGNSFSRQFRQCVFVKVLSGPSRSAYEEVDNTHNGPSNAYQSQFPGESSSIPETTRSTLQKNQSQVQSQGQPDSSIQEGRRDTISIIDFDFDRLKQTIGITSPMPTGIFDTHHFNILDLDQRISSSEYDSGFYFHSAYHGTKVTVPDKCLQRTPGTCSHECNIQCPSYTKQYFEKTMAMENGNDHYQRVLNTQCTHHLDCTSNDRHPLSSRNTMAQPSYCVVSKHVDAQNKPISYCQYHPFFSLAVQPTMSLHHIHFRYEFFTVTYDTTYDWATFERLSENPANYLSLPTTNCSSKIYIVCMSNHFEGQYLPYADCAGIRSPAELYPPEDYHVHLNTLPLLYNTLDIWPRKYRNNDFYAIYRKYLISFNGPNEADQQQIMESMQYFTPACDPIPDLVSDVSFDFDQSNVEFKYFPSDDEIASNRPIEAKYIPGQTLTVTWNHIHGDPNTRIDIILRGDSFTHHFVRSESGEKREFVLARTTIDKQTITFPLPDIDLSPNDSIPGTILVAISQDTPFLPGKENESCGSIDLDLDTMKKDSADQDEDCVTRKYHYSNQYVKWVKVPRCMQYDNGNLVDICQNGGTCEPILDVCRCPPSFIGRFCEYHICETPDDATLDVTSQTISSLNCYPKGYTSCRLRTVIYPNPAVDGGDDDGNGDGDGDGDDGNGGDDRWINKCFCAEGWSGERCDRYTECLALETEQCVNGFIEYDHDSKQCKTDSCTCYGNFTGPRCDECPLICKHGSPSDDCTTCVCDHGFTGEQCECNAQYITITFPNPPSYATDVVGGHMEYWMRRQDRSKEWISTSIPTLIQSNTYYEQFLARVPLVIASDLGITPPSRVYVHEVELASSELSHLQFTFGISDTCTNNLQDLRDVEAAWPLFLQHARLRSTIFGNWRKLDFRSFFASKEVVTLIDLDDGDDDGDGDGDGGDGDGGDTDDVDGQSNHDKTQYHVTCIGLLMVVFLNVMCMIALL